MKTNKQVEKFLKEKDYWYSLFSNGFYKGDSVKYIHPERVLLEYHRWLQGA